MKRLASSDSLTGLIPSSGTDEHNSMYNSILEEEGFNEESSQIMEKKRRLSVDQVKALEKNFEVENKLDPERKLHLAQQLDLQPRQVAVWFQNRRARWKTKQLERDHGVLKANFDALKQNLEKLHHENEALVQQIQDLKSKLNLVKDKIIMEDPKPAGIGGGASDSDSSGILNDSSPTAAVSSSVGILNEKQSSHELHLIKIEEQDFLNETFFSEDEAPTLHWYSNSWP